VQELDVVTIKKHAWQFVFAASLTLVAVVASLQGH
jgi:hypothetical protein